MPPSISTTVSGLKMIFNSQPSSHVETFLKGQIFNKMENVKTRMLELKLQGIIIIIMNYAICK